MLDDTSSSELQTVSCLDAPPQHADATQPVNPNERLRHFWERQPVVHHADEVGPFGPIVTNRDHDLVPASSSFLPSGVTLSTLKIASVARDLEELCELLDMHFISNGTLRAQYSAEVLRWMLTPPGFFPAWHISARDQEGKLVGFVGGIPQSVCARRPTRTNDGTRYDQHNMMWCNASFFCIDQHYRKSGLAFALIAELVEQLWRSSCPDKQLVFATANHLHSFLPLVKVRCFQCSLSSPSPSISADFLTLHCTTEDDFPSLSEVLLQAQEDNSNDRCTVSRGQWSDDELKWKLLPRRDPRCDGSAVISFCSATSSDAPIMCITFYTVRFLSHDVGGTGFCSAVLAELICPEAWKSRMIAAACHCLRIYHPEVDLVQVDDLHNGLDMAQFLNQRQDGPLFAEIPCEEAPLAIYVYNFRLSITASTDFSLRLI